MTSFPRESREGSQVKMGVGLLLLSDKKKEKDLSG